MATSRSLTVNPLLIAQDLIRRICESFGMICVEHARFLPSANSENQDRPLLEIDRMVSEKKGPSLVTREPQRQSVVLALVPHSP